MLLFYRLVFEDNEHGLFTVTLFKKVVDETKGKRQEVSCIHFDGPSTTRLQEV